MRAVLGTFITLYLYTGVISLTYVHLDTVIDSNQGINLVSIQRLDCNEVKCTACCLVPSTKSECQFILWKSLAILAILAQITRETSFSSHIKY